MTTTRAALTGGLLITAGHAIWNSDQWHGGFPGEDVIYAAHIRAGLRLLNERGYEFLAFSGGRTRPQLENQTGLVSEAEGMKAFAIERGDLSSGDDRIILETWARDSMENVFFSILAFFDRTGRWPARVGIVSWSSKGLRFHLICSGMRLGGRIAYYGVGDYLTQTDLERACSAEARFNALLVDISYAPPNYRLIDPLLRNKDEFAKKRWARMPSNFTPDSDGNKKYMERVKAAYGQSAAWIASLVDEVEELSPGDGWRKIAWPWL